MQANKCNPTCSWAHGTHGKSILEYDRFEMKFFPALSVSSLLVPATRNLYKCKMIIDKDISELITVEALIEQAAKQALPQWGCYYVTSRRRVMLTTIFVIATSLKLATFISKHLF